MFPLKQRKLIRGAAAHIRANLGAAADYVAATGTPLYAPFDGVITAFYGHQGGNWIRLTRSNGDRIEMAHLDRYVIKSGNVRAGDVIAYTGNTGSITTGPHKHIQIIRDGKRLDPERYNWEESVILPPMDKLSDHTVDGMPADKRIAALKEQVNRLQNETVSLTDQVKSLTEGNEDYKKALKEEQLGRAEDIKEKNLNFQKWQNEIEARQKVENDLIECQASSNDLTPEQQRVLRWFNEGKALFGS